MRCVIVALYFCGNGAETVDPLALAAFGCCVPYRVLFGDAFDGPGHTWMNVGFGKRDDSLFDGSPWLETRGPFTFALFRRGIVDGMLFCNAEYIGTC